MGKYMNKSKIKGDVAVMDVGVRTRAKTLALQRLQSQSPFQHDDSSSLYYLQLRSRRLEKPVPPSCRGDNHGSRREIEKEYKEDVEASCGENCLDSRSRDRTTRESTPCSLIRDPSNIVTPGSTSRRKSSVIANQRTNNDIQKNNPIMHEVEEFFACVEQQQQREFMEKYNFDIANDLPLPGRYDWVKIF